MKGFMQAAVLQNNAGIIETIGVIKSFLPNIPRSATTAYGVQDTKNNAITTMTRAASLISALRLTCSLTCRDERRCS